MTTKTIPPEGERVSDLRIAEMIEQASQYLGTGDVIAALVELQSRRAQPDGAAIVEECAQAAEPVDKSDCCNCVEKLAANNENGFSPGWRATCTDNGWGCTKWDRKSGAERYVGAKNAADRIRALLSKPTTPEGGENG